MTDIRYNRDLAQRFVNDMNLPIQVIDAETFQYWLNLYEDDYQSMTLWNELWQEIDERFGGDYKLFLEHYYKVRDEVIKAVTENEAYKRFNKCDMSRFNVQTPWNPRNKELYNEENVEKYYVSFDLVKSNIQALNYADKDILFNSGTYDEFIAKFTNSKYIARSKYFRQVVFGQMNPKRHITIAKYLISKVYDLLCENGFDYELVCVSSDEIVFEIPGSLNFKKLLETLKHLSVLIYDRLQLNVRAEAFKLCGYHLKTEKCNHVATFYMKVVLRGEVVLKSVPLQWNSIVYKLIHDLELESNDYVFQHDRCRCVFNEKFEYEQIEG